MEIEKVQLDLLTKAQTLCNGFDRFCKHTNCLDCELRFEQTECSETIVFIALCVGYVLGADKQPVSHDTDEMLKELFPNFYEYVTKRKLQP